LEGQLGGQLVEALAGHEVSGPVRRTCDISSPDDVEIAVAGTGANWVIAAAAMTDVDGCESHPDKAFAINAAGALYAARSAAAIGARTLLISTDYVFDGRSATDYVESDPTAPLNVYGASKLAGEHLVRIADPAAVILRTSGLFGRPGPESVNSNFVDTMLRLGTERSELSVVDDERLSPTYAADLAGQITHLIESNPGPGVYHAASTGDCSWFEFASAIFERARKKVKLRRITAAQWGAPAKRPARSVLDNAALRRAGLDIMPPWQDALERYLAERDLIS